MKEESKHELIIGLVALIFIFGFISVWRMNDVFRWINSHFDDFFMPYLNMGTLFWLIVIVLPIIYALIVIQPFMRYRRWKHPEEFETEKPLRNR